MLNLPTIPSIYKSNFRVFELSQALAFAAVLGLSHWRGRQQQGCQAQQTKYG